MLRVQIPILGHIPFPISPVVETHPGLPLMAQAVPRRQRSPFSQALMAELKVTPVASSWASSESPSHRVTESRSVFGALGPPGRREEGARWVSPVLKIGMGPTAQKNTKCTLMCQSEQLYVSRTWGSLSWLA